MMYDYKRLNNLVGWVVFSIATITYFMTMQRTVSFWDCGEFIATAYKLQVAHSPGAPLFMMLGRLFTLFAPSPDKVALMANAMSAVMSSFTILFLFWTITHFAKRLAVGRKEEALSFSNIVMVLGAGTLGALAYTFSDTFWFSAVEAEVYASSSFFTAIVFWAILKWEHNADKPHADRWLILISYLMGLSIGVHLLNLLTIPALAMVYYFRRSKVTFKGGMIAFFIGCLLLAFVQYGVIQGIPIIASYFELFFVNSLSLPFDSGALFFIALLMLLLTLSVILAKKKGKYFVHLFTLCIVFVMIGYSSFVTIILRSRADVPIDMTNPDDVMSLVSYLKRDQYGSQPLIKGQDYHSVPVGYKQGKPLYREGYKENGKPFYEQIGYGQPQPEFASGDQRLFPRMWSSNHAGLYQTYLNIGGNEIPTAADNYSFFFRYQLNWMWWRYVMWNYTGRQNDFQGSLGEAHQGNWISGIQPIDKLYGRGDMDLMPKAYKDNAARVELYFLPFLLGVLGMVYQFNRNKKDGTIVALLFFFTGAAIVMYLNNTPQQPRERDYAYAGSTYAFAIWIGLGLFMIRDWIGKILKKNQIATVVTLVICLFAVPVMMASKEWKSHDRSQKRFAWASAYNVLMSCDSNAILFTVGDNDTYPVWYLQEVEGIRPDVRVVNLSLLGIDWYIDQLYYKINDADPVPMIWTPEQYAASNRNFVVYRGENSIDQSRYFNLEEVIRYICNDDPRTQLTSVAGDKVNILPTRNFSIPVDKEAVVKGGIVKVADTALIADVIRFSIGEATTLDKSELGMLNIIAAIAKEGWKRPICFSAGFASGNSYLGLDEYIQLEGLVHKLVPIHTPGSNPAPGTIQRTDLDKSVELFLNTFEWGGAERKDLSFDDKNKNMMMTYRITGEKIALALMVAGRQQDAIRILDKIISSISYETYHYDQSIFGIAHLYYELGETDKARAIAEIVVRDNSQMLNYISSLKENDRPLVFAMDGRNCLAGIQYMAEAAKASGDAEKGAEWEETFKNYFDRFATYLR